MKKVKKKKNIYNSPFYASVFFYFIICITSMTVYRYKKLYVFAL